MATELRSRVTQLIKDQELFREACFINGRWIGPGSSGSIPVDDPATGDVIGAVPKFGRAETRQAIDAAAAAWPAWRARTGKERAILLRKWFDLIMASQDDLARLMTLEQGKPLTESRAEVAYGASFIEWFAEEASAPTATRFPQQRATNATWCSRNRSASSAASPRGTSRSR